jgi:hypothetical protein
LGILPIMMTPLNNVKVSQEINRIHDSGKRNIEEQQYFMLDDYVVS